MWSPWITDECYAFHIILFKRHMWTSKSFDFRYWNMHKMFAGLAGDTQTSKDDKKAQSKGHTGRTVLIVLLGIGAVVLLSFFLFKYWQKKKREEQHARLLKLFEEDDDIEVELGLRDWRSSLYSKSILADKVMSLWMYKWWKAMYILVFPVYLDSAFDLTINSM